MFANTQMMGIDTGFPDVCKTPTPGSVPMTYPIGTYEVKNKAANTSPKVTFSSKDTIVAKNEISRTKGDEVGTMKGVVSSVTMGRLFGNAPLLKHLVDKAHAKGFKVMVTVKAEGKKAALFLTRMMHNSSNPTSSTSKTYPASSGSEGMEWLLSQLD